MKLFFNLLGLLSVMVVSGQSGKDETRSLEPTMVEQTKKFLRNDGITLKIMEKFFELNFEPELRALMHMSLNYLVPRQLLGHGRNNLHEMPFF